MNLLGLQRSLLGYIVQGTDGIQSYVQGICSALAARHDITNPDETAGTLLAAWLRDGLITSIGRMENEKANLN
jgi:hypothetical protein